MEICDGGHQEIVYNGRVCPLCELQNYVDDLEEKIKDLENDES